MALILRNSTNNTKRESVLYSDIKTSFSLYSVKNDLENIVNEDSVKTSIKNILLTNRGERFFNNTFGSDIRYSLFENFNSATEQVITELVRNAIENFETRANILDILVSSNDELNQLNVTIIFSILNKSEPITFEFILNRIR